MLKIAERCTIVVFFIEAADFPDFPHHLEYAFPIYPAYLEHKIGINISMNLFKLHCKTL